MRVGNIIGICFVIALPIMGAISNANNHTADKPPATTTYSAKPGFSDITSAPELVNRDTTSTQDTRSRQTHGETIQSADSRIAESIAGLLLYHKHCAPLPYIYLNAAGMAASTLSQADIETGSRTMIAAFKTNPAAYCKFAKERIEQMDTSKFFH